MLFHRRDGMQHAFTDCHARHDDDEFLEPINFVQLENRAEIDIGFTRAGLHLDGEFVAMLQRLPCQRLSDCHACGEVLGGNGRALDVVGFLDRVNIL